jgi:hypothetical protein
MSLWAKPREICRTRSVFANPNGFAKRGETAVDETVSKRFIKK